MKDEPNGSRSPSSDKLIELIKQAIGTRTLRQVDAESGISHGLLGKVLNGTQKASVDLLHKQLDAGFLPYRINHISWREKELPTLAEMEEGRKNLAAVNNEVDFIVTHCCASSAQALFSGGLFTPDKETTYFEEVKANIRVRKWFFGHYHDNRNVSAEEIMLYEQIIRIS